MKSKQYTIPIFVPHYGCPFDCVFCNQEKITGFSTDMTKEKAKNIIDTYLSYFDKDVKIEVGFFGGSFTGIKTETQEELLSVAYDYKNKGKIDEIRLSTRPDFINQDILKRLIKYSVDTIELGVQSLDDSVLIKSGRGHETKQVYEAVKLIKEAEINLGLQMMVGLPGDDFQKSLFTCKEFIKLEPECVRIYPTLVIKDTDLAESYRKGIYQSLSLNDAIEQVAVFIMLFDLYDINIIRVGLQPTDNIQLDGDVIDGPFHPAFRQLTESYIYKTILDNFIKEIEIGRSEKDLIIKSNSGNISEISGNRAVNKTYLLNKYSFRDIKIYEDNNIKYKDLIVIHDGKEYIINYKKFISNYLEEKMFI